MQKLLLVAIRLYQQGISPALGARCRFEPTCSHYAYEAIAVHGSARGSWLAVRRLLRCRPGHPGGYDPVPGREAVLRAASHGTVVGRGKAAGPKKAESSGKAVPTPAGATGQHPKIVKN